MRKTIQEYFGVPTETPVEMGQAVLHIQPNAEDVAHALRPLTMPKGMPEEEACRRCVFAVAAARQYPLHGIQNAAFFRKIAYIILRERRKIVIKKYVLNAATTKSLKHFDETGEMPEHGIQLYPVTPGRTPEGQKQGRGRRVPHGPRKRGIRRPDPTWIRPRANSVIDGIASV